ncbi:MAG: chemoreceptor glutamine deamidase CheD [Rhodocyclaceae bacterium]|nr:chemoreceptor glutamine deamidase CheD [Rhodocyclaceae bacterium]
MPPAVDHAFSEHLATNRYYDRIFDSQAVKVLPGEYYVAGQGMLLVTVLGSCVSACIRDRRQGVGGMNHFMLPDTGRESDGLSSSARYGAYAMEVLVNHLIKLGAQRRDLEAKVFGGGKVMASLAGSDVGTRNAAFVRQYLSMENIPIVAEDLLDIYPRKVYFFPESGRVMVKKLVTVSNTTVVDREQEYAKRLGGEEIAGDVELFG